MINATVLSVGALVFLVICTWFVRRQRRRHADTRAGWGGVVIGLGQLLHGIGSFSGDRQPLGVVLATCSAILGITGAVLVLLACRALGRGSFAGKR
ncbi:hypothetical protein [Streptomyces sp. HGB0020]|uniref:hypothetical protein n=1 Tax=Streptomyces sp. HGB0020 TaxID=1078086 RepID=UPI00034E7174|nr:hypothetical protein [Streptomyces sp. HGB0020]EPD63747.1 hypothetical protein HMPREF1211_02874 [Streptomyces sp. HGB0020]